MSENFEALKGSIERAGMPHLMHGDVVIKGGYPTHTHGLESFGLPELFINSTAFGPQGNGHTINELVRYLSEHEDVYDKVANGEYVEIVLWIEEYPILPVLRRLITL